MTFYPDLGTKSMVASGHFVRAVGWLSRDHTYSLGDVSPEFLQRLKLFAKHWRGSTNSLGWGIFRGFHTCEFCRFHASGNFGVPSRDVLFVAPEMIVHYIEQHGYAPPREFIAAVLASPLPDTQEYCNAVLRFRNPTDS